MQFKKLLLSATAIAGIAAIAAPANAMSLKSDEYGNLFDTFNGMVNSERLQLEDSEIALKELDVESLRWDKGADGVDVFFINEGAGYRNQLFYSANGGNLSMIFDDIASTESVLANHDGPLALGDGVSLGAFSGNTSLDFVIKANGKNNSNGRLYGADATKNADGLQHVIAYEYFDETTGEDWVVLGFEDLYGVHTDQGGWSDRDFNDVVVAVRGVTGDRLDEVADVPEPSAMFGLLGLGLGMWQVKRRKGEAV
ncbi:MAG: DUF4114 domain-containing protein [Cyanophyceae cyanobacterium]